MKDDQLFAKSGVYICALLESSSGLRKREIEQLQSHIDGCGGAVSTLRALGRKATAHKKDTPLGLPLKQQLAFTYMDPGKLRTAESPLSPNGMRISSSIQSHDVGRLACGSRAENK